MDMVQALVSLLYWGGVREDTRVQTVRSGNAIEVALSSVYEFPSCLPPLKAWSGNSRATAPENGSIRSRCFDESRLLSMQ